MKPTRESIRGEQARRFADRLRGELTLTKTAPDVTRVRIYVPAPFSPMPLVRVEQFDSVIQCAVACDDDQVCLEECFTNGAGQGPALATTWLTCFNDSCF